MRKPIRDEGIVSRKPRSKSAHDFLGLLYCFIVLLCICVVSCPYMTYFPTVMARCSLFVLKVPLNTKQASKQANKQTITGMNITAVCVRKVFRFIRVNLCNAWHVNGDEGEHKWNECKWKNPGTL